MHPDFFEPNATASTWEPKLRRSLGKIAASWERRAQVKVPELLDIDFDPEKPDFPRDLLPFHDHPVWKRAAPEAQQRLLTYGWLAFNQKAIDIERNVLVPACSRLLNDSLVDDDGVTPDVLCQTLVDESFHVLMIRQANALTLERRQIDAPELPLCTMVESMWAQQHTCRSAWERDLVVIGAAIVTEVFIKGYLSQLSRAEGVQRLSVVATKAHLTDEMVHSSIFRLVAEVLYHRLDPIRREFFVNILIRAVRWFSDPDLQAWDAVVAAAEIPGGDAMMAEVRRRCDAPLDYEDLALFLTRVGVEEVDARLEKEKQQHRAAMSA